jgi:alkanesulfonate monooxygenase SsuD/methylene tetrahydromethanopterin reductase-like flavin-dependent oxidoreductase (luciferase family)
VRIGVSENSRHDVADVREGARWMVERAAAAREAGLDSLFVGDHHASPGPYYQNVPILARMLAEWGDAPAGCLFLMPLWNPVLLAEQVGTLASIHKGRFIIQAALGGGAGEYDALGANIRHRPSLFEESLDIIQRLFNGETVSADHRFTFKDAVINPRPPERVEFWSASSGDPAIDRAARLMDGWLAWTPHTYEEAAERLALYNERCTIYNRTPAAVAIRRDIFVAADEDEAEAVRKRTGSGYRGGFDPRALVIGTIPQVAEGFRAYAELGFTDVIVRHVIDDQPMVLASLARLKEVRAMVIYA